MRSLFGLFSSLLVRASREIESDKALRFYGVALSLNHLFTTLFWSGWQHPLFGPSLGLTRVFASDDGPLMCIPTYELCGWIAQGSRVWLAPAVTLYSLAAIVAAACFCKKQLARTGYWLLFAMTLFKFGLLLTNSSFLPNYYMMMLVVSLPYLFFPGKRLIIPVCVATIYLAAGFLKLNQEWLSGAALPNALPDFFPSTLIYPMMIAAVVFETIVVFGLFSHRSWIRWIALATAISFHLVSIQQVGPYYPLIALGLLSIFPLVWNSPETIEKRWLPQHSAYLVILIVLQLVPRLFPGDSALTGQARMLAFNMIDADVICENQFLLSYKDSRLEERSLDALNITKRVRCDPLRYINEAKRICAEKRVDPTFLDLDVSLIAKRTTGETFVQTLRLAGACSNPPEYKIFEKNEWIPPGVLQ